MWRATWNADASRVEGRLFSSDWGLAVFCGCAAFGVINLTAPPFQQPCPKCLECPECLPWIRVVVQWLQLQGSLFLVPFACILLTLGWTSELHCLCAPCRSQTRTEQRDFCVWGCLSIVPATLVGLWHLVILGVLAGSTNFAFELSKLNAAQQLEPYSFFQAFTYLVAIGWCLALLAWGNEILLVWKLWHQELLNDET